MYASPITHSQPPKHSTLLIVRVCVLIIALLLLCTIARGVMVAHFLPQNLWQEHFSDFWAMWIVGLKLDMRAISIAMLIFIALHYLLATMYFVFNKKVSGGGHTQTDTLSPRPHLNRISHKIRFQISRICTQIYTFLPQFYAFLLGFIFMVAAIVNFYYFRTYGNKIDIFIFGLKNDDTLAILEILWRDYPLILGIISAIAYGIFTLFLYNISHLFLSIFTTLQPFLSHFRLRAKSAITLISQFLCIILLIIGARGSLGTYPLKEDNYRISTLPIFNHLATNPLLALDWAYSNYKADAHISPPSVQRGEALQEALFPLLRQSPYSMFLKDNPPHIVVNLMESFGSNMLIYDELPHNDLLGALRKHFDEDFVFFRFLSGANGTLASFFMLFFDSPTPLSRGSAKTTFLPYNPFAIYANAGYEVIYITSGYESWQNTGDYMRIQGVQHIYDALHLMERFPQSKKDKNAYGIPDEYAYKLAFEILSNAQKPTFIAILTTSNHPPYHLPHTYAPKPITLSEAIKVKAKNNEAKQKLQTSMTLYQYANNAFGEFLDRIKDSALKSKTIIAATGDHLVRDFSSNPSTDKAIAYAVPFYIYVPQDYAKAIHYDSTRIGSHKDIFPTLYELSLSHTQYMSVGGRNILAQDDNILYAFGYNGATWIDKEGIYPISEAVGYMWGDSQKGFGLLSSDTQIALSPQKKAFGSSLNELFAYAIAWRIFNPNPQEQLSSH